MYELKADKKNQYLSKLVGDSERVNAGVLRLAAVDAEPDEPTWLIDEVHGLRWTDRETWGQENKYCLDDMFVLWR